MNAKCYWIQSAHFDSIFFRKREIERVAVNWQTLSYFCILKNFCQHSSGKILLYKTAFSIENGIKSVVLFIFNYIDWVYCLKNVWSAFRLRKFDIVSPFVSLNFLSNFLYSCGRAQLKKSIFIFKLLFEPVNQNIQTALILKHSLKIYQFFRYTIQLLIIIIQCFVQSNLLLDKHYLFLHVTYTEGKNLSLNMAGYLDFHCYYPVGCFQL